MYNYHRKGLRHFRKKREFSCNIVVGEPTHQNCFLVSSGKCVNVVNL